MLDKLKKLYREQGLEGVLIHASGAKYWPKWLLYYMRVDLYAARRLKISTQAANRMRLMLQGIAEADSDEIGEISAFWCAHTRGMQGQAESLTRSLLRDIEDLGLKICRYKGEEGIRGFLCAYTQLRYIPAPGSGGDRLVVRCSKDLVCMGYGLVGYKWRLSRLFAGMMKYRFDTAAESTTLFVADVSPLNKRSYRSLESLGFAHLLKVRRIKILGLIRFWQLSFLSGPKQWSFSSELEISPEALDEVARKLGL